MNTNPVYRVAGIAGSLRRASFNRALLRTAVELSPERLKIDIHDLIDIPVYNQDVEDAAVPAAVTALRDAVRTADALLIATPEYNHGVPGILKNQRGCAPNPRAHPHWVEPVSAGDTTAPRVVQKTKFGALVSQSTGSRGRHGGAHSTASRLG